MKHAFIPLLTVLFIGLKLTGHIDWSWLWVLSPMWITFAVVFVAVFVWSIMSAVLWSNAR